MRRDDVRELILPTLILLLHPVNSSSDRGENDWASSNTGVGPRQLRRAELIRPIG